MKLIKRDGRIEEFQIEKIVTSISNAADDANVTLNESDISVLKKDILNRIEKIRKDTPTSSYEVIGIIISILKEDRFSKMVYEYISFES